MPHDPQRILVTGAAGFIGRQLTTALAKCDRQVFGVDRVPCPASGAFVDRLAGWRELAIPSAQFEGALRELRPDVLIHAAAPASVSASVETPAADFHGAVPTFFDLLDAVRRLAPGCRVVFLSSAAVYGDPAVLPIAEDLPPAPISPYGFHKLLCETLATEFHRLYGVRICTARVFSAYGPGLRRQVLWDICQKALQQPLVELIGKGDETRDFIHVQDICRAVICIVDRASFQGEVYNVASGIETSVRALAEGILAALQDLYGGEYCLRFSGQRRPGDPVRWRANIERVQSLGFAPTVEMSHGTRDYVEWVAQQAGVRR